MSSAIEIKVLATAAVKEAYLELVPQFEQASGHKVVTLWVPAVDLMAVAIARHRRRTSYPA